MQLRLLEATSKHVVVLTRASPGVEEALVNSAGAEAHAQADAVGGLG